MTETDDQLFIRIRNNDYGGFNQLFHRYYGRLCQFAARYTNDQQTAEDIVQELFIRLWNERNKILIRERLSAYLFKSTRNACLNFIRQEKRHKQKIESVARPDFHEERDMLDNEEFVSYLSDCIERLPEKSRQVFIMSRLEETKLSVIAEKVGVAEKTVKNQLWKSMQFLKSCMEFKRVL